MTALRWFPGGLVLPVLVLLLQARQVDLATTGALFAIFGGAVALLELATGGLADVPGHRRTFRLSSAVTTVAFALLAAANHPLEFGLAFLVLALGRSLSSGPLQAWYVNALQALDPLPTSSPDLPPRA